MDTIAYQRPAAHRIEGIARKAGTVVFHEVVSVTPDGTTLTMTITVSRLNGEPLEGVAVFEKRQIIGHQSSVTTND